jgi:two-component system phosphate regulon response regulator PhoB
VPADLAKQANRLHKLQGGAALLGAKTIQQVAAQAEAACVAGAATQSGERSIELAAHLDALRSSAARTFEGTRTGEWPIPALSDIWLEPQAVARHERIKVPSSDSRRADSQGQCRVLVVDDDDIVRKHVASLLERSGYRVAEAASGEEALRAVRGGDYQIVITDWKMPGMSGLELCRELRAGAANRDLFVMMLSMSDRQQDVDLCRVAGADDYILKSASNEEIITRVAHARHITQLRSSARETERV